jgi:hypothetical protein
VDKATDLHIVGTFEGKFVLSDSALEGLRTLSPVSLPKVLYYTHTRNLSSVHLALDDSYQLYTATLPAAVFPQEVPAQHQRIPKNIQQALSPEFVGEWGPAIDRENQGFRHHNCFAAVPLPSGERPLPGLWVFTRKRDGSPKPEAWFCVGGHRQIMGRDYFPNKNYCAVLSSRDNCILLALAAAEATLFIRLTLSKRLCTASWTMLTFTLIPRLVTRVLVAWCSNFSKLSMVLSRLL